MNQIAEHPAVWGTLHYLDTSARPGCMGL